MACMDDLDALSWVVGSCVDVVVEYDEDMLASWKLVVAGGIRTWIGCYS